MPMKNPPHPGGIVKDCIEGLGLSIMETAKVLDVARPTLPRLINGRSAISPEKAIRLSLAFGSTPELWLRLQTAYDLAQTRARSDEINVQRYEPQPHPSRQPVLGA